MTDEATPEQLRRLADEIEARELASSVSARYAAEVADVNRTSDELMAVYEHTKVIVVTELYDCPTSVCTAKAGTPCGDSPKDTHLARTFKANGHEAEILKRARERRPDLFARADRYRKIADERRG